MAFLPEALFSVKAKKTTRPDEKEKNND